MKRFLMWTGTVVIAAVIFLTPSLLIPFRWNFEAGCVSTLATLAWLANAYRAMNK